MTQDNMPGIRRRNLFFGGLALAVAPAIVQRANIMRIKAPRLIPGEWGFIERFTFYTTNVIGVDMARPASERTAAFVWRDDERFIVTLDRRLCL